MDEIQILQDFVLKILKNALISNTLKICLFTEYIESQSKTKEIKDDLLYKELEVNDLQAEVKNLKFQLEHRNKCSVCLEKYITHVCIPCGHYCICQECITYLVNKSKCPICNNTLIDFYKVYES
jgi:hypothetical protein